MTVHAARPTQTTASISRPPAHHPTRQHAASAGSRRRKVSSTGSSARSGVYGGMIRNAASASRSFPHPRSDGAGASASCMSGLQAARVGKQRQIPRALDRDAQLTLMPRAHAAQTARENLTVVGDEPAERTLVLVVHETHAALAERASLRWASHGLLLILVVVIAALLRERELFLAHRRRADFVLVDREQVADHAPVELERALVLGDAAGFSLEARDDVVAVLAWADRVGELATPPVIQGQLAGGAEELVEAIELFSDGRVFERRVE